MMETYVYTQINNISHNNDGRHGKILQKPFLRQLLVCSGVWMIYFVSGLIIGAPTVLIPQIRKEANSYDAISDDMASWMTSILGIAGIPSTFILPLLMYFIGRKISFGIVCLNASLGFIVFCCSSSVIHIFISQILLSTALNSAFTLLPMIVVEYSSPKYRGVFLAIKSATNFWGIWVSNAIGTFYYWKYIGYLGLINCFFLLTIFIWPESPYWLATRGRFEECASSYRWLRGTSERSEKELEILINSQKQYIENMKKSNGAFSIRNIKSIFKSMTYSEYYKPLFLCSLLYSQYFFSGKLVYNLYAIDIFKKVTSEATAYKIMLILDGVTVFSMYAGCGLFKYCRRRTLLFTTSTIAIIFLFILSLYLYLVSLNVFVENDYIMITLLVSFTLCISSGPMVLITSIHAELIPLRYKSSITLIDAIYGSILFTGSLKLAPSLFKFAGLHGTFLIYGVGSSIVTCLLYKYLPETKDKTMQEIEGYFKSGSKTDVEAEEMMNFKQET